MNRSTIPKPADRDEWLAERLPFFNASATSILFNRHPYITPGDYATIKLTGEEQGQTRAMIRGTMLEDAIAQWWAIEHAATADPVDDLYVCDRIMATLDRWCPEDYCPVEIKTTKEWAREPMRYWLDQCQASMLCAGADACWLVWFDADMDIHELLVRADTDLQTEIHDRAERFMAAIDMGIVPDWIELSYDNVARLHPHPAGAAELDDAALDMVRELATLRQIKRDAEKEEKLTKDALAKVLLDHEVGTWNGIEVLSWRTTKPSFRLDVDMLTADHPDLVEKYSREIPGVRRMLTKLSEAS